MTNVANTKPFAVVFTLVQHPYFGVIVEANAVPLLANGQYSLSFQRIREKNADYFGLNPEQKEILKITEEFEADAIMKKFYTESKKIKKEEFFQKYLNPEKTELIRKYIEIRLIKLLPLLANYPTFYTKDNNTALGTPVEFARESATVLFHFRRNENGTNYFATIKHNGQKVNFAQNNSQIICTKPAWLLSENTLYHFAKNVDGNKFKPFLYKKYVHVEPRQESIYMEKFVQPLLENYSVYAEGFDIVTEQFDPKAILKFNGVFEPLKYISFHIQYGAWEFPFHSNKNVNVSLEKTADSYKFRRIKRNKSWEEHKLKVLSELGLEMSTGSLFSLQAELQQNIYSLIQWLNLNSARLEQEGFVIDQTTTNEKYFLHPIHVEFTIQKGNDWFDLLALVQFGNFSIPFSYLRKNILERKREFVLPDGSIAILPESWFSKFNELAHFSEIEDEKLKLKNIHVGLLESIKEYLKPSAEQEDILNAFAQEKIEPIPAPENINALLRNYQLEGYQWILHLHKHGFGALLADDMGLGKTLQTLAVLQFYKDTQMAHFSVENNYKEAMNSSHSFVPKQLNLFETNDNNLPTKSIPSPIQESNKQDDRTNLIVAPKSLLHNWYNECKKFAPGLDVKFIDGIEKIKKYKQYKKQKTDIIIMSYGTLRNDVEFWEKENFFCVILDESQAIKNPGSLVARATGKIRAKYKIALTGTPLENSVLDVWSQMNFLNPGLLGNYHYFEKKFIKTIEKSAKQEEVKKQLFVLKKIIDPFVLRRTKKSVAPELPEKTEKIHYCEMNEKQKELYEITKNKYRNELLGLNQNIGEFNRNKLKILNGLMHLRQIALNPCLKDEDYVAGSGKDDEIFRMLDRAFENGHKVLLFSQFVSYLEIFKNWLEEKQIPYCYLDGSLNANERIEQVNQFQNNEQIRIFLLSLRAGNSGLNLTAADYVFLADPWWNPFTMKQAEDRAHRIGQDKQVFSYKFITKDTIEEKILQLQYKKSALAENLIPDEDSFIASLDYEEITDLLS